MSIKVVAILLMPMLWILFKNDKNKECGLHNIYTNIVFPFVKWRKRKNRLRFKKMEYGIYFAEQIDRAF